MPIFDLLAVVEAKAAGPSTLWLRFSDGAEGTVDLSGHVPPMFRELSDPGYFARVEIAGGAVQWPNGFDCDPEWLRSHAALSGPDPRANDDTWETLRRHARRVPEISRFFGIIIRMLYNEHAPPHFHAQYAEHEVSIEIDGVGISGGLPSQSLKMLLDWRDQHRAELLANWDRMRRGEEPVPIAPLD